MPSIIVADLPHPGLRRDDACVAPDTLLTAACR